MMIPLMRLIGFLGLMVADFFILQQKLVVGGDGGFGLLIVNVMFVIAIIAGIGGLEAD